MHLVTLRKMPFVLPHNIVCESDWPQRDPADVQRYWQNLSKRKSPVAAISPEKSHVPLWIWGDECEYRENGDELLIICMGYVLDTRKFSIESCYPIVVCRCES